MVPRSVVRPASGEALALRDSGAAATPGRRPLPFLQFVLKLHSRCNLTCDYCYVYTMADQRWRTRPRSMSKEMVDLTAARVADHIRTHGLSRPEIILHGGEPLLAGLEHLRYTMTQIRSLLPASTTPRFCVQTNGVLLDEPYLILFDEFDVSVGVSVDGDRSAHDRHRKNTSGLGSHAAVERALNQLSQPRYRHLLGGLLCTIDIRNDPVTTYEALLRFGAPSLDFLLPHGNWSAPPPYRRPGATDTPYADWLVPIFDRWYHSRAGETGVRIFEEIINVLLGGASSVEGIGLSPTRMVIVETDGEIEQSDFVSGAHSDTARTGLHVTNDSFDAVLDHPDTIEGQIGAAALSATCQSCRWWRTCGGGLRSHRYRDDNGFANPSVYCPDLYRLIEYIRDSVAADVKAAGRPHAFTGDDRGR